MERAWASLAGHLVSLLLFTCSMKVDAEKMEMDFLIIGRGQFEEDTGRMAAVVLGARDINEGIFFDDAMRAQFGDCEPDIRLHLRNHEKDVVKAAGFVVSEVGESCAGDGDPTAGEREILGIINDFSSISAAVSPVANVFSLPMVSYSATSPKLNEPTYSNFFRTIPDDSAAAVTILEYMATNGIRFSNVIYSTEPYGIGFAEALLAGSTKYGVDMKILAFDEENPGNVGLEIEASEVNVWVIVLNNPDGPKLSAIFAPVKRPIHFIFSETLSNSLIDNGSLGAETLKRMTGSIVIKAQGYRPGYPQADELKVKLREDGVREEEWLQFSPYFQAKYNSTIGSGKFPSPHDVSSFSYDAIFAMAIAACTGPDIQSALPGVEFQGVTGHVKFKQDTGTRDPVSSYMTMAQLQHQGDTASFVLTNEFVDGAWGPFSAIVMEDGMEFQNLVPTDVEEVRVNSTVKSVIFALAAINIAASLCCAAWALRHRRATIVRHAQIEFLYVMCLGCIISSAVPIIIAQPSDNACKGAWIAYALGFSLTIGSLSAKTIRISRIVASAKKLYTVRISFLQSLPPMLTIIAIDVGIAFLMQAKGDVAYVETDEISDEFGRVLKREYRCQSKGPFMNAFFVCNILILAFLAILCYKARKISSKFSESKYISMALVSSFQIVLLSFILILSSENTPTHDFLMISLMTIITDGSTLCLIFGPKIYLHMTSTQAMTSIKDDNNTAASTHATRTESN